jgi:hypothetical protein
MLAGVGHIQKTGDFPPVIQFDRQLYPPFAFTEIRPGKLFQAQVYRGRVNTVQRVLKSKPVTPR